MAENVKVLKIDTNSAQTSVKDLRNELKELKNTLLSTEQGTEEYNAALQQAAEIQHTLKEQMEEINASAMDFGQIASNCTQAVGGLVGGFQAATAVMNLFGTENEDVIRTLKTMQQLMAMTQALPAIDKGVKAFKRLALAIRASSTAMQGFSKALIATGLGAAVAALGLLIANWDKIKNAVTGANDEMEKQEALQKKIKTSVDNTNTSLEKQLSLETKIRQAFGQSDVQIAAAELDFYSKKASESASRIGGLRSEVAQLNASLVRNQQAGKDKSVLDSIREKIDKINESIKVEEAVQADLNKKVEESKQNVKLTETIQKAKDLKQAEEDAAKARKEAAEAREKELEKLKKSYEDLVTEINNWAKSEKQLELDKVNKEEEKRIEIIKKQVKDSELAEEQITKVREHYAKERADIEAKYTKKAADEERNTLTNNYDLQLAELQAHLDDKLISQEQYNARKKELDETYKQDYIDLLKSQLEDETISVEERIKLYEKLNEVRSAKPTDAANSGTTLSDGITDAINASALALNDFSDNPAWGKVLQNVAILTANWKTLHKQIEEGGTKAFSAYAQIAAAGLGAVANMMNGLAAEQDTSNKEGFESAKKFQIAGATMSMLAGIASAWASSMQLGPIAGPILGAILSAMMTAVGIAQIVKIKNTKFDSKGTTGGASSNASINTGAVNSIIAPVQYTQDVQGASIEGAIKDTKVFVTETDISSTQNKVHVSESEARY